MLYKYNDLNSTLFAVNIFIKIKIRYWVYKSLKSLDFLMKVNFNLHKKIEYFEILNLFEEIKFDFPDNIEKTFKFLCNNLKNSPEQTNANKLYFESYHFSKIEFDKKSEKNLIDPNLNITSIFNFKS